jgi:type IV pilus assembly protein PilZ
MIGKSAILTPNYQSNTAPETLYVVLKNKAELQSAYISLFDAGGIFVPTSHDYRIGDAAYVLLTLPDDPQNYAIAGKVAWLNAPYLTQKHMRGIGVVFPSEPAYQELRSKIESILGPQLLTNTNTSIF